MTSQFNAIDFSQLLQAVGVATRADLAQLKRELTIRMEMFEARIVARMEEFEAGVKLELAGMRIEMANMRTELSTMRSEIKYNRRMINLVLALQVALIVKMFFP